MRAETQYFPCLALILAVCTGRFINIYDGSGIITSPTGKVTRFVYDLLGRQTAVIDPSGNVTQFVYDERGLVTEEKITLGSVVYTRSFAYDAAGNQTLVVDRNGRARTFDYNAMNEREVETWYANLSDAQYQSNPLYGIQTRHDVMGRIDLAQTGDNSYGYIYDEQDRLIIESLDHLEVVLETAYDNRRDNLRSSLKVLLGFGGVTDRELRRCSDATHK